MTEDLGNTGNRFLAYMGKHRRAVENYLYDNGPHAVRSSLLHDDLDRALYCPLRRFTARGGKRTRPILAMLGCEAVGGDPEDALPIAYAVEYFQSAALIHDDIADEGELRRGKPCLHLIEGVGPAINDGDLGIVSTYEAILGADYSDTVKLRLLSELAQMEHLTVEGQALDLAWVRDGRWDVTPDDYRYMAWHKTACYSAASPLAMGAICGGGSKKQVHELRSFGLDAGLAFQLQDDLLNLVGDAVSLGKDYRNDITEGKRRVGVVYALANLEGDPHDELLEILMSHTADKDRLARAVELMDQAGAIDYTWNEAVRLVQDAKTRLTPGEYANDTYEVLLSMADFFVRRAG